MNDITQKSNQTCQNYLNQNGKRLADIYLEHRKNQQAKEDICLAIVDREDTIQVVSLKEDCIRELTIGGGIKLEDSFYQKAIDRIKVIANADKIPVLFIPRIITSNIDLIVVDLSKDGEITEIEDQIDAAPVADPTKVFSASNLKYLQGEQKQIFSLYVKLMNSLIQRNKRVIEQYLPLANNYNCEDPKAIAILSSGRELDYINVDRLALIANPQQWTINLRAKAAEGMDKEELAAIDREAGFNPNLIPKTELDRELFDCLVANCSKVRKENKTPIIVFNFIKDLPKYLILGI